MFRDRGCQLKCSELLADTEPWLGQFGKLRKRRVLTKKKSVEVESSVDKDQTAVTTTRRGHKVLKPARFMTISSDSQGRLSLKKGEVVRTRPEGDRERGHATGGARTDNLVAVVQIIVLTFVGL